MSTTFNTLRNRVALLGVTTTLLFFVGGCAAFMGAPVPKGPKVARVHIQFMT
ncbi:MAG: hypothetical protein AAF581_04675 [Planctomycetota bacterium]